MTGRKVILAAGGTGGHIFPALALGDALLRRGVSVALITDDREGGSTAILISPSAVSAPPAQARAVWPVR